MKKQKSKIRTTSLTDDQFEDIKKIGEGSFTRGIRNMHKITTLVIPRSRKLESFDEAYLEAALKFREAS